jgi:GTP pyrophosphokinase
MGILEVKHRPPGYELFFAPLAVVFDPNTYEKVQFAYFVSKYGHARQKRDDDSRFFDHPKSAAWIYIDELGGRDPRTVIDLLLHDMPEDAYLMSSYRISLNFGVDIALDVRAVTKLPKGKETLEANLLRIIARGPIVILVKLCDRLHNVRTLGVCSEEKQKRKIAETVDFILPMLIPALRACGDQWSEYADILEGKLSRAIAELQR